MKKVAVIGSGAWGTAIGLHAARLGHRVVLWANESEVVLDIQEKHENRLFLPGIKLPETMNATSSAEDAAQGASLVVLVPPSRFLRAVSSRVAGAIPRDAVITVASKGIEESSLRLMSQVLAETLTGVEPERLSFLSGPTFAKEVGEGLPTDVVVASKGMTAARAVQALLHAPAFRVYTSGDPVGVEVGGAIKNVIAIATGACDALRLGTNARAALITRGLAETTRLGVALGADPLTFLGLAGIGDLVLTCTGDLSRNRTLGKAIAEGVSAKQYLAQRRTVAEGFFTAHAAYKLAKTLGVELPITEQVYYVLHEDRPLLTAMKSLMTREGKEELLGIR